MEENSTPDMDAKASAYSFSVDFNDQPNKPRRKPPKHLLERHSKRKEVSHESIEEKQRKAEDRRKKHIEDRLERVRQLEEEAMSLARAMQPLLEASAKKKEQGTPNGLHNPISARRRCAEDDPVNVRVMMVNSSTEAVVSELQAIDSSSGSELKTVTSSASQNGGPHCTTQNGT